MNNTKDVKALVLALMLPMLLSLVACNDVLALVTSGGSPETMSDPAVAPTTTLSLTPSTALPAEATETGTRQDNSDVMETNTVNITIGDNVITATLVDNSSVAALKAALTDGPITVNMHDYGNMEKVGSLGMDLPRNDQQITTTAGDIILYQGNALVIYYAPNSWNFTRLGKVDNLTPEELRAVLDDGDVIITLSLPQE